MECGNVMCVPVMSIVAPRGEYKKPPYVLDETLPTFRDPQEIMREKMQERILNDAKNKPDNERNFFDYLILAKDKIDKMPKPVCYMA